VACWLVGQHLDGLAKWLLRLIRNQFLFEGVGSNPTTVALFYLFFHCVVIEALAAATDQFATRPLDEISGLGPHGASHIPRWYSAPQTVNQPALLSSNRSFITLLPKAGENFPAQTYHVRPTKLNILS
jgi:hypothetical protein